MSVRIILEQGSVPRMLPADSRLLRKITGLAADFSQGTTGPARVSLHDIHGLVAEATAEKGEVIHSLIVVKGKTP